MKFLMIVVSALAVYAQTATAADKISYTEEMYALGTVCGQGLACKSQKYHQFELLARAIVVSKAANDQMQQDGMERYNAGKVDAFMAMEAANFADCDIIREEFDNQKIFQSVLYSDGRIKLYDGTVITPRRPYTAAKLYVKDREAFIKADAAYKKSVALAKKNAQNAKQVPLYDAQYESISKQF
ncbi:MAG: hypothetical protein IJ532_00790 [Alphaproteobacteria bacterium]|nr:hypothetical protein [Alphaproteobacteria bacterium]